MNTKYFISLFVALSTLSISYPILSSAKTLTAPVTNVQAKAEGKILGALIVLNNNEIAAGRLAEKKSSTAKVKNFAAFMIKEHSDNLNKTKQLGSKLGIKTIKDGVAIRLQNNGKKELATLKKLKGSSFDKAYIDAMVKGHMEALNLVDTLIRNASNNLVKMHLEMTKKHVKLHLEEAKAIQRSLQ